MAKAKQKNNGIVPGPWGVVSNALRDTSLYESVSNELCVEGAEWQIEKATA